MLEIQDTLKQPPSAVPTMKKALRTAVSTAMLFYMGVSLTGE